MEAVDQQLKSTALSDMHAELGAKMVPFAGYNMPLKYDGDLIEHETVRKGVGMFDVSHMGEFMIRGEKALDLIQWVSSNDASKLVDGKVQYSCLPNDKGGIVDDLLIYRIKENEYMLVVNASNIQKDWDWISAQNKFGAEMEDISDNMSLFAVQGPKAAEALQSLTGVDLTNMKYYTFDLGTFAGVENVFISATGYTGAGGFEIYVQNKDARAVWDAIMEAGKDHGIRPIGLGARDSLRLEMGYCLYGNDITDETSPLEAGLGWVTKFTKEFVNSEALKQQKEEGVKRKLVGFEMVDKGIPRQHYTICDAEGNEIGEVTSGVMSPLKKIGVGLGYVTVENAALETEIYIQVRKKSLKAKVVKPPFVSPTVK